MIHSFGHSLITFIYLFIQSVIQFIVFIKSVLFSGKTRAGCIMLLLTGLTFLFHDLRSAACIPAELQQISKYDSSVES